MSSKIPKGMFSGVEINIEVGDSSGNILMVVLPGPIFIYERVNSISPSPIEGGCMEELGIIIPLWGTRIFWTLVSKIHSPRLGYG